MALSKLAVRRLTKLADFMETIDRSRFNMSTFQDDGFQPTKCGTSACALGWAWTITSFKRAGLERENIDDPHLDWFFGVNRVYDELFSSELYDIKTPKQWAAHCRKFIRDNS